MRHALISCALVLLVGCGGSSPTSPSPSPTPAPVPSPSPQPPPTFSGTVTDTVSGAPILGFTALVAGSRVTVSAPGYVTRETVNDDAVDLIHDAAPFDLGFYRQLVRGALTGANHHLLTLTQAPSIYLQTAGLPSANITALEQAARAVVPAMTGGRFQVQAWETGDTARPEREGWIVVELVNDTAQPCGLTSIGASAGHSWLNIADRCSYDGQRVDPPLFAHELGHALGFEHVADQGHLMHSRATFAERRSTLPSDLERYHAAIAYHRPAGNRDPDIDP